MGKPKTSPTLTAAGATPAATPLAGTAPGESSLFEPDDQTTGAAKNAALVALLASSWQPLAIVRVERVEVGGRGWRVVFRE